jgi:hypothetical protein
MVDVKLVGYFFKYVTYGLTSPTALLMGTFFVLSSGQPLHHNYGSNIIDGCIAFETNN